jgi:hypothetical protein
MIAMTTSSSIKVKAHGRRAEERRMEMEWNVNGHKEIKRKTGMGW